MAGTIKRPLSEGDIITLLSGLSGLVPRSTPADIYIGGSAAFLLCAGFRGAADLVADRKAQDIDYYASRPSTEFLPVIGALVERYGDPSLHGRYHQLFDEGGFFIQACVPEADRYFYKPISLNPEGTGLSIYVLKEEPQLAIKIGNTCLSYQNEQKLLGELFSHVIDKERTGDRRLDKDTEELMRIWAHDHANGIKGIADIDRLCVLAGINGFKSFDKVWRPFSSIVHSTAGVDVDRNELSRQWRMVRERRRAMAGPEVP